MKLHETQYMLAIFVPVQSDDPSGYQENSRPLFHLIQTLGTYQNKARRGQEGSWWHGGGVTSPNYTWNIWVGKTMSCLPSPSHPPVITIFRGGINKPCPVMAGENGIVLPTLLTIPGMIIEGAAPRNQSQTNDITSMVVGYIDMAQPFNKNTDDGQPIHLPQIYMFLPCQVQTKVVDHRVPLIEINISLNKLCDFSRWSDSQQSCLASSVLKYLPVQHWILVEISSGLCQTLVGWCDMPLIEKKCMKCNILTLYLPTQAPQQFQRFQIWLETAVIWPKWPEVPR